MSFQSTVSSGRDSSINSGTSSTTQHQLIRIGTFTSANVAMVSNEMNRLTSKQREVIKNTFKLMQANSVYYGTSVFVRLLSEHPEYKTIWPQFRSIPDSSIVSSDALRRHACAYMNGLKVIIDSMDDDEKLAEETYKIAKSHLKWGVRSFHLETMLPAVIAVLRVCMHRDDQLAEDAWSKLFDILAKLIEMFRAECHALIKRSL
ncbi:unnamed protein product [Anisakis simplex]|uniref:GLOBIN domain-containing protein n=1 Tax=Anisakis simplex TaxID=6269 RepID=A0A0M3K775_ANISI|nr:unnamed protein product [Anisakis simplex]